MKVAVAQSLHIHIERAICILSFRLRHFEIAPYNLAIFSIRCPFRKLFCAPPPPFFHHVGGF